MSTIRAGNTTNTALITTGDTTGQLNLEADSGIINTGSVAGGIILPSGTTAQRPATPLTGMLRFNTTNNELEVYTAGWLVLASRAPTIVSVSPVTYNGESGTSFTITGTNFIAGAQVYFIDSSNVEYAANSVVIVSSTSITIQTPQDFTVAQEPLKLKIVQSTGTVISPGLIDTGNTPAWTTASGNIGTIYDSNRTFTTTIVAVDTDSNSTLVYSLQSGSLPTGLSLNTSTGVISGTVNAVATDTTSTFTIRATDNAGNSSDRQFNIVVKAPVTVVYNYSGATTTFTVPTGVTTLTAKLWGGGGGNYGGGTTGGGGGYSTGSWTVSAGQSYIISVGGAGGTTATGAVSAGGFGGGGAGGVNSANSSVRGGGGGGYSGIFINSVSQANAYLIAGGGGGAQGQVGGAGGGSSGVQGSYGGYAGRVEGGYGGTQSAGGSGGNGYDTGTAPSGSALQGGAGGDVSTSTWNAGGGGGGGYFGGGGGAGGGASTGAGGGGSGYVRSGVTGSTTAGSGATAANSGDSDRTGNAGNNATNGLIILKY